MAGECARLVEDRRLSILARQRGDRFLVLLPLECGCECKVVLSISLSSARSSEAEGQSRRRRKARMRSTVVVVGVDRTTPPGYSSRLQNSAIRLNGTRHVCRASGLMQGREMIMFVCETKTGLWNSERMRKVRSSWGRTERR